MPTSDSDGGAATVPPSGYRLPPAPTEVIRQQAAVVAVAAMAHVPVVRPPVIDTRGFLSPFLDGQKAFRATFDATKLLGPTFDTRAMLGPAFDVTKLLGPTFDTMRLFDASVAAIARGHSGTMEDWLAPVISEIVGTSAEQDVETGLSSVRP